MEQPKNDRVQVGLGHRQDGQKGVLISIPQSPVHKEDGEFLCDGLVMLPHHARQLAYTILFWAETPNGDSIFTLRTQDEKSAGAGGIVQ